MAATGHAHARRRRRSRSTGDAWFDHQWGDFISVGGGGWDWFAVNLDDGTDLTLSLVRAADGSTRWSTARSSTPTGATRHLARDDVRRSTSTGDVDEPGDRRRPTRPAGRSTLPGEDLVIDLGPPSPQQELDTRATTGRRLLGGLAARDRDARREPPLGRRGRTWSSTRATHRSAQRRSGQLPRSASASAATVTTTSPRRPTHQGQIASITNSSR